VLPVLGTDLGIALLRRCGRRPRSAVDKWKIHATPVETGMGRLGREHDLEPARLRAGRRTKPLAPVKKKIQRLGVVVLGLERIRPRGRPGELSPVRWGF
jgi:hypothetical protein